MPAVSDLPDNSMLHTRTGDCPVEPTPPYSRDLCVYRSCEQVSPFDLPIRGRPNAAAIVSARPHGFHPAHGLIDAPSACCFFQHSANHFPGTAGGEHCLLEAGGGRSTEKESGN